jgi:hypothetical protein
MRGIDARHGNWVMCMLKARSQDPTTTPQVGLKWKIIKFDLQI